MPIYGIHEAAFDPAKIQYAIALKLKTKSDGTEMQHRAVTCPNTSGIPWPEPICARMAILAWHLRQAE